MDTISPPIRVLDYGYTAPNPIDYGRMALAQTQPLQEAVMQGNEAKNRFLLSQIEQQHAIDLQKLNAQKAMELAQWQHKAQIQREQMRDQRMLEVAKLRAQSVLDAEKEKGALDDIKNKSAYLSRIGGGSLARGDNETDTAYGRRLEDATKAKMTSNIATDAKAAYSIQKQIKAYNDYLSDPRVTKAIGPELQSAFANPGVQAQAANTVNAGFDRWLQNVAGQGNYFELQDALDRGGPQNHDVILRRAGLWDAYQDFKQAALQQSAYAYLKAAGSPAAKQIAGANENLSILNKQLQNISMMPGDNGRMVPKPWWSQVQNSVDDLTLHDKMLEQHLPVAQSVLPTEAPVTAPVNPILAPAVSKPNDPYGYAEYAHFRYLNSPEGQEAIRNDLYNPNPVTPISADNAKQFGIRPPVSMPAVTAEKPSDPFLFYSPRFSDGTPSNVPFNLTPQQPLPAPVITSQSAATQNNIVAPTTSNRAVTPANLFVPPMQSPAAAVVVPQPTANPVMFPSAPALQQVPAAVSVPASIPVANPVVAPMPDNNPYDAVMQSMMMRNLYAQ